MSQSSVSGDNAISVIVDGDRNIVTIQRGEARLALAQRHRRRSVWRELDDTGRVELDLLITENRAIDLVGRDQELAQLSKWLEAPDWISFWCVSGRGGAGKTRLAIDLCEWAEARGWTSGFASDAELTRFHQSQNLGDWRWEKPTLIVVDYAAASQGVLRSWLAELAVLMSRADISPLRLLLLERNAEPAAGWWNSLISGNSMSARGPETLLNSVEPLRLRPIPQDSQRRAIINQVILQAATILGRPAVLLPPPGANPELDRRLRGNEIEKEPLYLAMAGLVAVREGLASALALDRGELAKRIVATERSRLQRLAHSWGFAADPQLVNHVAACITLQGGCAFEHAGDLIRAERIALGFPSPLADEALATRIGDAIRAPGGSRIDAIRPDLIGEMFVLAELEQRLSEGSQMETIERAWRRDGRAVISTLVRIAQDFAGFDPEHSSLRWLRMLATKIENIGHIVEIIQALPEHSVALRRYSLSMQKILVGVCRQLCKRDPSKLHLLAGELNNYSARLVSLGLNQEALEAADEAVAIYRALQVDGDTILAMNLAISLINVGNHLQSLGKLHPALSATAEAVEISTKLRPGGGDHVGDLHAMSLNSFANSLSLLGRHEEALEASRQVANLYRELARNRSEHRPDLAGSLVNLATRLAMLRHGAEALAAIAEAMEIYREFAVLHPDAYRSELAMALINYGSVLHETGSYDAALEAVREAAAYYEQLCALHPGAFAGHLANTLSTAADYSEGIGNTMDGLKYDERAIRVICGAFETSPVRFKSVMAAVMNDYLRRCLRNNYEPDGILVQETSHLLGIQGVEA